MNREPSLAGFAAELRLLMGLPAGVIPLPSSDAEFNRLALHLFSLQFEHNPVLRTCCQAQGRTPQLLSHWTDIPAIPARAFKEFEVTSIPPTERSRLFRSSGTTMDRTSRHFHFLASLEAYEASLTPWFAKHLLPAPETRLRLLSLIPDSAAAPHSSLAHMVATVRRMFASSDSVCSGRVEPDGSWSIDLDAAISMLHNAKCPLTPSLSPGVGEGVVFLIVGTAFGFVHLLEELERRQLIFTLPSGSRVMETGGYKGRTRALPQSELHGWITARLGVPSLGIVCEYGMSELSSQAYDLVAGQAPGNLRRCFHFPPWARARVLSPETGREVGPGETGLLQVVDLANVWSACSILTEDLAVRLDDGFRLVGRASQSEPKGCSLMGIGSANPTRSVLE